MAHHAGRAPDLVVVHNDVGVRYGPTRAEVRAPSLRGAQLLEVIEGVDAGRHAFGARPKAPQQRHSLQRWRRRRWRAQAEQVRTAGTPQKMDTIPLLPPCLPSRVPMRPVAASPDAKSAGVRTAHSASATRVRRRTVKARHPESTCSRSVSSITLGLIQLATPNALQRATRSMRQRAKRNLQVATRAQAHGQDRAILRT